MVNGNATVTNKEPLFLDSLRSATAPMHAKLEQTSLSLSLMRPELTLQEYTEYVLHMRNVIAAYESVLRRAGVFFHSVVNYSRLSLIEEDLAFLSALTDLSPAPVFNMPSFDSEAQILGCMYVIEGSALGGRMILNHVKAILGFNEEQGARFFAGAGIKTGILWKQFLEMMTTYVEAHKCEAQVIAAAQASFAAIHDYFM